MTLTCSKCGSKDLLIRSWISLTNNKPVDGPTNTSEEVYCNTCQKFDDYPKFVPKGYTTKGE